MKYWKLMAGKGSKYLDEFLDNKRITIGFTSSPIKGKVEDVEEVREIIAKEKPQARKGQITSWGSQLYRFCFEMQKGDRVLVYDAGTRIYHIADVTSDVQYDEDGEHTHIRDVDWVDTISRDDLSTGTRNTLGAILTIFEISNDPRLEIEKVLAGEKMVESEEQEEEGIEEIGEETVEKAREYVKDKILNLDWQQMQELVAALLRSMGYRTRVSAPGPDRGKDVEASPDGLGLEEPRIRVEVKHRQNSQMGSSEIRSFIAGLRDNRGLYVSTGGFSREAFYEAERSDTPIRLIDIDEFARLITQYYDDFDVEARNLLPLRKIYWPM
jgi:restriction system protein